MKTKIRFFLLLMLIFFSSTGCKFNRSKNHDRPFEKVIYKEWQKRFPQLDLHGYYKEYDTNGKLYISGNYVNGKKEGKWLTYSDGKDIINEENYVNDKKNGISKLAYGTIGKDFFANYKTEIFYKDNIEIERKVFNEIGKIIFDIKYKNGSEYNRGINISLKGKWFDKYGNHWDFSEDGNFITKYIKTNEQETGEYKISEELILSFNNLNFKIKYLTNDSIFASEIIPKNVFIYYPNDFIAKKIK